MADVITRFKLETTQYDSKLRDASKSLAEYTRKATQAGNEFGKFTQKNVEAARALGNITPSATNAKDKVKELVGAFNDAARAYNALTKEQQQSDFGRAMAESIGQLSQQLKEAKQELYGMGDAMKNTGGGGLFSGLGDKMSGALQVFAGNMLTKAAGAVANLGSEIFSSVQQGIELARQGEGIRLAFERLGRGDILDGLRQATHGTVTDIELMKAAVKFNDFKLPLDELGTMLAFAQKKAKDTGQSVDYMVDSIVTGLGRKSLMILDNLGLSASEVKDKMAETGDMTKAVGEIIREQMAKAGDYVETAADRAAQANVSLQNKMEELGRKFAPIEEASSQLWTSMKIGILDIIGGPLATLLNQLTEAGRLKNQLNNMNGGGMMERFGNNLRNSKDPSTLYSRQLAAINRSINAAEAKLQQAEKGGMGSIQIYRERVQALKEVKKQYEDLYKTITSPAKNPLIEPDTDKKKTNKGGGNTKTEEQLNNEKIQKLTQEYIYASDARQTAIRQEIKVLQERNAVIKQMTDEAQGKTGRLTTPMPFGIMGPMVDVETKLNSVKGIGINQENPFEKYKDTIISIKTPLQALTEEMKNLAEAQALALTPEQWSAYQTQIEEVQKKMGTFKGDGNSMAKEWGNAAQAITAVGSAMSSIEDPAAKVMGTIAQAIATIALTYAKSLEKTFTPWDWIAAAASGAATMISVISAIHSSTGYANGGIVKGNSYSGDNIPAMIDGGAGGFAGLNAGEIVLNKAAQGNLASQLQGAGFGGVNMVGEISGESIKIVLNRHLKRTGQGEIVTW